MSRNSEYGRNWGLEITPQMFRPFFIQEISSRRVSTCREGLKSLIFIFSDLKIVQLGVGISKFDKWPYLGSQKVLHHFLDKIFRHAAEFPHVEKV